jgi:hypothetical protein
MNIFITILFAGCLFPIAKDTPRTVFNKYTVTQETKVPANYYTTKTGFFCNAERAFEKQTKVKVRLRLGSVEHTQKLEGYSLSTLPSSH